MIVKTITKQVKVSIIRILLNHKCKAHLNGFRYLASALEYCYEREMLTPVYSMSLYEELSKIWNTTTGCIERSLRYCIEHSDLKDISISEAIARLNIELTYNI